MEHKNENRKYIAGKHNNIFCWVEIVSAWEKFY